MAFILTSVSPALLAQDMADALVSATFENGVAELDLSNVDLGTMPPVTFVYANASGCDYKVLFGFYVLGNCTTCMNSAGVILANTTSSSFSYTPPLSGCSGTVPCRMRIIEIGGTGNAFVTNCTTEEMITTVGCTGSPDYNVAFYECGQVRIYE